MAIQTYFYRKNLKPAAFGGVLAVLALAATGCSGESTGTAPDENCTPVVADVATMTEGKLKVLEVEHPPFVTMEGNQISGIEGDLVQKVADDLCLELDVQITSFAGAIEGLQNNRGDLSSANWSVNDERRELFEVSNPMYENTLGVVTRGENWDTIADLEGKKIGTPQGYLWNEDLKNLYGDNVTEYQSDIAVMDDVKAGRIDAGFVNSHANNWRIATHDRYEDLTLKPMQADPAMPYTQETRNAVVLIKKGNTDLKDAVDVILQDYIESGEMQAAFEKYGLDPDAIASSDAVSDES